MDGNKVIKRLLLYFLTFGIFESYAQKVDTAHYYTGITTTGTYNKTNAYSSYVFSNNLDLSVKKRNLKAGFHTKWLYGKQQQELVNNDLSTAFNLDLYKTFPHFYYWLLFNYNTAYSLKINNQLQTGLGVAYILFDTENAWLNISDGVLYDYSDIYVKDSVREIYQTPRNSFRLQLKLRMKEKLNFSSVFFLQNSFLDENDYIIRNENTVSYDLKKWLKLSAKCTYDRMNRTAKENLFLTYGLTVELLF